MKIIILLSTALCSCIWMFSQGCDTLNTQWITPTPTSSNYGFGGGWISGVPDPVNSNSATDPKGVFERFTSSDPGVLMVNSVQVGLGYLKDTDNNMTFGVNVYDDNGSGIPGTLVGGISGISPVSTGVPGFNQFDDFWISLPPNTIPTTGTFHIGIIITPGDASDTLCVESSCLGPVACSSAEGENDGSNHIYTSGFGYENLLSVYGADFDFHIIPVMCATVLPVEILNFYGESAADKTILAWEATFDQDFKGFEIQKSSPASDWHKIGFRETRIASSSIGVYNFEDHNPYSGPNYYRLKLVDLDGKIRYSSIITINYHIQEESVKIFPNPANKIVNLQVKNPLNKPVKIVAYDCLGRKIWQNEWPEGNSSLRKEINFLKSGYFYVFTQIGNRIYKEQVLILP